MARGRGLSELAPSPRPTVAMLTANSNLLQLKHTRTHYSVVTKQTVQKYKTLIYFLTWSIFFVYFFPHFFFVIFEMSQPIFSVLNLLKEALFFFLNCSATEDHLKNH